MSRARIFAYGSNMHPARMLARVPGARARGAARLAGHRLVLNKRGQDGSAKANLVREAGALVWGVVWELTLDEVAVLDGHEGGYERRPMRLDTDGGPVAGEAYVSERTVADALPFDWYLAHLVRGAREFGFPEDYVAWLEGLPCLRGGRPG